MNKGLYILNRDAQARIYGPEQRCAIDRMVNIIARPMTAQEARGRPQVLREVEILFSGWGCPRLDENFLELAPRLKQVFYGAGTIRDVMTPAAWERGVCITSAYAANAIPVAEFAVSQIIFCLKLGWQHFLRMNRREYGHIPNTPGAYGSTVGLISLGQIGRRVSNMLRRYDVRVIAYDPLISAEDGIGLDVEMMSLEQLFAEADVVSLHTPELPETQNLIAGDLLSALKMNASFINTARGSIVNESEMINVLKSRPDLVAVLDVTCDEPPVSESPLWTLPNAVLLPHIAGSMNSECSRMGVCMVDELERYVAGIPLKWQITRDLAATLA
jgi:phosphoglycerate dehydrogenase-like enzyme